MTGRMAQRFFDGPTLINNAYQTYNEIGIAYDELDQRASAFDNFELARQLAVAKTATDPGDTLWQQLVIYALTQKTYVSGDPPYTEEAIRLVQTLLANGIFSDEHRELLDSLSRQINP